VKAAAPEWIPATMLLRELRALGYPGALRPFDAGRIGWQCSSRRNLRRVRHR
jgi:hypothetical protein